MSTGAEIDSDAVNVDDDVIDRDVDSGAPVGDSGTGEADAVIDVLRA